MAFKLALPPFNPQKFIKFFWYCVMGGMGLFFLMLLMISWGWFGKLPSTKELEDPTPSLASEVFADDSTTVLGRFYIENRSNSNHREISQYVYDALIATEDVRFEEHSGIDTRRLISASLKLGTNGGASTITQQLAKNLFKTRKNSNIFATIWAKLKEWVLCIRLERLYTKEEIITMYLNTVQFQGNAFGIKTASKVFFNKTPDKLNLQESATLVGLLKAIGKYNPISNPEKSKYRRNTVLEQMTKNNYLKKEICDSVKLIPIETHYSSESHTQGSATYFREYLREYLNKWCDENNYNLYRDGLKIYTTINAHMQQYAEEAVAKHMKTLQKEFHGMYKKSTPWKKNSESLNNAMQNTDRYIEMKKNNATDDQIYDAFYSPAKMKIFTWDGDRDTTMTPMDSIKHYLYFLNCGFMSMNPKNGFIKAWVGGVSYKFFKVDHVSTKRQPGSTFKPFTYAYAVDNGIPPCTYFSNTPPVFKGYESWQPKNADGSYGGSLSMRTGIALSINCIAAQVLSQFNEQGPQGVIDLCRKMGITSDLKPYPTICLGVFDVSVYEMVGAYSTFANGGVWTEPIFIQKIVDKNGNLLQDFSPRTTEAMGADKAYVMLDMMKGCVNFGTGVEVRTRFGLNTPIAAKTGTTSNYADGWFIGITPDLVSGGWVGNDDRTIHFPDIYHGCGGHMSLPIWAYYMQKVYADRSLNISQGDFEYPKTEIKVDMNCSNNDDAETYKDFLIGY